MANIVRQSKLKLPFGGKWKHCQLGDQDSVFYEDGQDDIEDQGSPSYTSGNEVPMSDLASSVGPSTGVDASETEELSTAMTADTANHNNIPNSINSTAAECLSPIPIQYIFHYHSCSLQSAFVQSRYAKHQAYH